MTSGYNCRLHRRPPPPRAVGHTFEFSFPIPKPANAGNSSKNQKKTAGKSFKKNPKARNTTEAAPNPRTEPDPSLAEDRKRKRAEYGRARNQTPDRKEYQRVRAQEQRRKAKELGLCKDCSEPAIPGQTRCPTCAEKRRESRRRRNANTRS